MTRPWRGSRRDFHKAFALSAATLAAGRVLATEQAPPAAQTPFDARFPIRADELTLRALLPPGRRALSFAQFKGAPEEWRKACRQKLAELLGYAPPAAAKAERRRSIVFEGVTIEAWIMTVSKDVTLPAYLLMPETQTRTAATAASPSGRAVMAIHGHGAVEPCLGQDDDYHHAFALRLAQAGHLVLCPELRGFGALADMAASDDGHWLDYWDSRRSRQFTLVTDGFLYGQTLIGQTVADLIRWENWLAELRGITAFDVAGISYGGDLALTYPVFSERVRRIYASGSLGSFAAVFARCYNAPAHCVPGILQWMDRSDIAGLNAPRPLRAHYGEHDTPGPDNASAAYNETARPALDEVRAIYRAFGGEDKVTLHVTRGTGHEMDNDDLRAFLA